MSKKISMGGNNGKRVQIQKKGMSSKAKYGALEDIVPYKRSSGQSQFSKEKKERDWNVKYDYSVL
jgi:hypothetical protein